MTNASQTTITQLTPSGRGAVASVEVRGPRATELVESAFTPLAKTSLSHFPLRRIVVGHWRSGDRPGEELVVCRSAEDRVEIHCHGGPAAVAAIIDSLVSQGAARQTAEEWSHSEAGDAITAEARLALSQASTERTALILLDQYHGALHRNLGYVVVSPLKVARVDQAAGQLQELYATWSLGQHLTKPWRVAIVGRPNVGKSSLLNALLGYARSIVFNQPGTTRDVVVASTALDGWPTDIADTAGLRDTCDAIEQEGVRLAEHEMLAADLVIQVHDATSGTQPFAPLSNALLVVNKIDLIPQLAVAKGLRVSATTGQGLDELTRAIVERLVPCPPRTGAAVLFTPRQAETVARSLKLLTDGDPRGAMAELNELLGSFSAASH